MKTTNTYYEKTIDPVTVMLLVIFGTAIFISLIVLSVKAENKHLDYGLKTEIKTACL